MTTPNDLVPTENELKAADVIDLRLRISRFSKSEDMDLLPLLIAKHTRTADASGVLRDSQWWSLYAYGIEEGSAEWEQEAKDYKKSAEAAESARAKAERVVAAARVSADGFITGLLDSDKRKGDLNRLADALVDFDASRTQSDKKGSE